MQIALIFLLVSTTVAWALLAIFVFLRMRRQRIELAFLSVETARWRAAYDHSENAALLVWPNGNTWDAGGHFGRSIGRTIIDSQDLPQDLFDAVANAFSKPEDLPARVALPSGGIASLYLSKVGEGAEQPLQVQLASRTRPPANLESGQLDWTIFETCPLPMWVVDGDTQILSANRAYADAVEQDNSDLVVANQTQILEGSIGTAVRDVMRTQTPLRERRVANVAGTRRNVAIMLSPVTRGQVLVTAVDVTGEEEALGELAHVLDAQSETLDRLRTPVAIFGARKSLQYYNSAFRTFVGLSDSEMEGSTHEALLEAMYRLRRVPEQVDIQAWKNEQLRHYTTLIEAQEDMWYLADGTSHRAVIQPYPFGGLLWLIEDVTDRLELERSYNTLVEVQRETLDNMAEGVATIEADGSVSLFNPAFIDMWSLDADRLSGAPKISELTAMIPIDNNDSVHASKAFKEQLPAWISERIAARGRWLRDDGRIIDYRLVLLPDGGTMLTQSDVTDSARIEQALRERSYALEAADRVRSEFISNMSYEFRTPLNSILGFGEILSNGLVGDLTEKQRSYIINILKSATALRDIISDVLDLAAIESGGLELEFAPVSISDLISSVVAKLPSIARRNSLSFEYKDGDYGYVTADRRRLSQALNGIFLSLVGIIPREEELRLSIMAGEFFLRVMIDSEHCGSMHQDRDHIVMALQRGQIPEDQRNSGLHLALARSIITMHGGRIEVIGHGDEGIRLMVDLVRDPQSMELSH